MKGFSKVNCINDFNLFKILKLLAILTIGSISMLIIVFQLESRPTYGLFGRTPRPLVALLATVPRSGNHLSQCLLEQITNVKSTTTYGSSKIVDWLGSHIVPERHLACQRCTELRSPRNDSFDLVTIKTHFPAANFGDANFVKKKLKSVDLIIKTHRNPITNLESWMRININGGNKRKFQVDRYLHQWANHHRYYRQSALNYDIPLLELKFEDMVERGDKMMVERLTEFPQYLKKKDGLSLECNDVLVKNGLESAKMWGTGLEDFSIRESLRDTWVFEIDQVKKELWDMQDLLDDFGYKDDVNEWMRTQS